MKNVLQLSKHVTKKQSPKPLKLPNKAAAAQAARGQDNVEPDTAAQAPSKTSSNLDATQDD